jgi:L-alanine-DL-glutamate epimerase-like enolase superfamily enzyme
LRITGLQVYVLRAPDTGRPHWVSHFIVPKANEILVRAQTDDGIEGIGIATSYTPIEAAIHAFRSGIAELVIGADPLRPSACTASSSRSPGSGSRTRRAGRAKH